MSYVSTLSDGTVLLSLHVQPKASKSRVVGLHDGCLKVAVAAPPVEGRANKEVVKLMAGILGIAVRHVTVKTGTLSRKKLLAIKALPEAEVRAVIEKTLQECQK
ncbi:DUF167 domain-containing protein [Desulfocastanea catecholica]